MEPLKKEKRVVRLTIIRVDMEPLKKEKRVVRLTIIRAKEQLDNLLKNKSVDIEIVSKMEAIMQLTLTPYFEKYNQIVMELMCLLLDTEDNADRAKQEDTLLKESDEIRDIVCTYQGKIRSFHSRLSSEQARQSIVSSPSSRLSVSNSTSTFGAQLKLQKIDVPKFDGELTQFYNFKNLFGNLVHDNPELTNVQKLYYLKQALIGEAEQVLRDFELSDGAYAEAWSYFLSREQGIRQLIDQVNVIIRGLKVCGEKIDDTFSRYIAYHVSNKLDTDTAKDWKNSLTSVKTFPKYEELEAFLKIRAFAVEDRLKEVKTASAPKREIKKPNTEGKASFVVSKTKCILCTSNNHSLHLCPEFKLKSPQDRFEVVKGNKLCLICFNTGHNASACRSKFACKCGAKHNRLLHFEFKSLSSDQSTNPVGVANNEKSSVASVNQSQTMSSLSPSGPRYETTNSDKSSYSCSVERKEKLVVLPTAVVKFICNGVIGKARILLDGCSQATLVSDSFVKKFKLSVKSSPVASRVKGVGTGSSTISSSFLKLVITSRNDTFRLEVEADLIPATAMKHSANFQLPAEIVKTLKGFPLADPAYLQNQVKIPEIDLLLGGEYYWKCLCSGTTSVGSFQLCETQFGWIVGGAAPAIQVSEKFSALTLQAIDENLEKFWQLEEASKPNREITDEAVSCVDHFNQTYSIGKDGKFIVRLPFKMDSGLICKNRSRALSALHRVERNLDMKQKEAYNTFMQEYREMQHMSVNKSNSLSCFLPHHAVLKPNSLTTPLRVVFNASARDKNSVSLNEALMVGPVIQRELFDILVSMRSHKFVFTCDIAKMYRMIWLHPEDRLFQTIWWRDSQSQPLLEYQLNTVTYGTASASFTATKCLDVIANSMKESHPDVAKAIRNCFYVDDFSGGANSLSEAVQLRVTLHDALARYGFQLRKYASNSGEILKTIPVELLATNSSVRIKDEFSQVAILGISWHPRTDAFSINFDSGSFDSDTVITRRVLLSLISRTFDPLGFLSPVTIRGKLLLQKVWLEGKGWDDVVSEEIASSFITYMHDLYNLKSIRVPRYLLTNEHSELVAFCDASDKAYCVAVYVRSLENDKVNCRLVCSKTKVAPLKQLTIPKLELQAASLLMEVTNRISRNSNIANIYAFSDSTVVLCWLSKPASEWKVFISNRVKKITSIIPFEHWYYVRTDENPADAGTRGLEAGSLVESKCWFNGPQFLYESNFSSVYKVPNLETHLALERRKTKIVFSSQIVEDFTNRFSSYVRLVRVVAHVLCALRAKSFKRTNSFIINAREFNNSATVIIRFVQSQCFESEIRELKVSKPLKKKSRLRSLDPFLDEEGLLRVGGRIQKSSFSAAKKHPIILSAKSHFVKLLCRHLHEKYFHAGRNFLAGFLASKYWLVGGRTNLLKSTIRTCVDCARVRGKVAEQIMGQLPLPRVSVSHPFTHCGIDLAGPFMCKCVAHRSVKNYKIYVAVFLCLTVRAVHLEIVSDLSSQKFLDALQRFVARRGMPACLYSDNATNFVGASNFLESIKSEVIESTARDGIEWSFIPPRSPNFGGAWEAAVKSAKAHLLHVTHGHALTFEEYGTLLARIEAIMNSRPLCYKLNVEQDSEVITPGHFLVGESLLSIPTLETSVLDMTPSKRIDLMRNQLTTFWKVWSQDYMNQLQQRNKWYVKTPNIQQGQVVLLKTSDKLPFKWPLARVTNVYPGEDGMIRVVEVKLKGMLCKRSLSSIIMLPLATEPLSSLL